MWNRFAYSVKLPLWIERLTLMIAMAQSKVGLVFSTVSGGAALQGAGVFAQNSLANIQDTTFFEVRSLLPPELGSSPAVFCACTESGRGLRWRSAQPVWRLRPLALQLHAQLGLQTIVRSAACPVSDLI